MASKVSKLCLGPLQSYDATTHFETTVADVLNMYTLITGKVNVLKLAMDI